MTDVLRAATVGSKVSRYRIAKATGILQSCLLRFMAGGTSLRLDKADALAAYLGLRLVPDPDVAPPEPTPENLARPMLAKAVSVKRRRAT